MKIIFASILTLFCCILNAQEEIGEVVEQKVSNPVKIGIKSGISLPKLTADTENIYTKDFESFVAYEIGVSGQYEFSDLFSLQVEFNYTVKGGERNGKQPIPPDRLPSDLGDMLPPNTIIYANFNNKSILEYIEIPVLAKFTFGKNWKYYGILGPYAGFLVGATQKTSGNASSISVDIPGIFEQVEFPLDEIISFDAETNVKSDIKNFNIGGIGGVGLIKRISKKSEIFIEARGTYGFITIQENETYGKSNIGSFVFSLGYAYTL